MPVLETPPNGELACCASGRASHVSQPRLCSVQSARRILPDQRELQVRQRATQALLPQTAIGQVGFVQKLHTER